MALNSRGMVWLAIMMKMSMVRNQIEPKIIGIKIHAKWLMGVV